MLAQPLTKHWVREHCHAPLPNLPSIRAGRKDA
jgi:hypothetical protein